jgi:hypothetical protein
MLELWNLLLEGTDFFDRVNIVPLESQKKQQHSC